MGSCFSTLEDPKDRMGSWFSKTLNLEDLPQDVLLKIFKKLNSNDRNKFRLLSKNLLKIVDENFSIQFALTNSDFDALTDPTLLPAPTGIPGIQSKGYHVHLVDMREVVILAPVYYNLIRAVTLSGIIATKNLYEVLEQCPSVSKLILNGYDYSKSTRPHGPALILPQLKELYVLLDSLSPESEYIRPLDPQNGLELLEFLGNSFRFPGLETLDISQNVYGLWLCRIPTKFRPMNIGAPRHGRDQGPEGAGVPLLQQPRGTDRCTFLTLFSRMTNLKVLKLRNMTFTMYMGLLWENNLTLMRQISKGLEVIQIEMDESTLRLRLDPPPPLPQFLTHMSKVKILQVSTRIQDGPQIIDVLRRNAHTLEVLDLIFCVNPLPQDVDDQNWIMANFELDLSVLAPSNNLKTLIIKRTHPGMPTNTTLTHVNQLPTSLRIFETDFTLSLDDLKFVTKNLQALEVFEVMDYSAGGIDERTKCGLIRDLLHYNPNIRIWNFGLPRQFAGSYNAEVKFSDLVSKLDYPKLDFSFLPKLVLDLIPSLK